MRQREYDFRKPCDWPCHLGGTVAGKFGSCTLVYPSIPSKKNTLNLEVSHRVVNVSNLSYLESYRTTDKTNGVPLGRPCGDLSFDVLF